MDTIKNKVRKFYEEQDMALHKIDFEKNSNLFLQEMEQGLLGNKSSLKMIPTYIGIGKEIPIDEPIIVLDAGGTNFRVATVYFVDGNKAIIEDLKKYPMPGSLNEISKEQFIGTIATFIESVIHKSSKIAFCFSYPTEITPERDGKLIGFCKEVKVKGLEGKLIGRNLLNYLQDRGYGNKSIIMLNDTVATLLAGRQMAVNTLYSDYMGFILGTGLNCSYLERRENIHKLKTSVFHESKMVINIESGAYNKPPRGKIDFELDSETINPGMYVFEKMMSGRYLGMLTLKVIRTAAKEGLFSETMFNLIKTIDKFETKDINDMLIFPENNPESLSSRDQLTMFYLVDYLVERASLLAAINIYTAIIKMNKYQSSDRPTCITAEGTTFYQLKDFKTKLEAKLNDQLNKNNYKFDIIYVENATIIGTAIAGLTH